MANKLKCATYSERELKCRSSVCFLSEMNCKKGAIRKIKIVQLTFYQYDTVMCRIDRWFHHVEEHQWWRSKCKLTYPCENNTRLNFPNSDDVFQLLDFQLMKQWLLLVFTVIVFSYFIFFLFTKVVFFLFTFCSPTRSDVRKTVWNFVSFENCFVVGNVSMN